MGEGGSSSTARVAREAAASSPASGLVSFKKRARSTHRPRSGTNNEFCKSDKVVKVPTSGSVRKKVVG